MAAGPTIVAKFLADTSQLTGDVDKAAGTMQSSIGSFAKKAALTLGGAFAAKEIIDFGKASVEAAAADAEAQSKLAAALKSTAGATDAQVAGAEKFISNLSKQAAIADDDLRPALATLARGFGDTEKAQQALSLATDISAGTGKDLSTVTEAMMKAAQGNTGALGRLGIATKDAAGNALSLDQIMSNAAQTFKGQASAAADSTAGRMRAAKIAFGEFQEQIGSALLPVLATLSTFFTGTLIPALSGFADWVGSHKDLILAAFIGLATGVIVAIAPMVPAFIAWAAAAGAAAVATLAAAAPFIAIGAVIAGVAFLIIHNWDTIVAATKAAWDAVVGAVRFVWDWIAEHWPLLVEIITGPIGIAVGLIIAHWDTIKAAATAVWQWVVDKWNAITGAITGAVSTIGGWMSNLAGYWESVKAAASAVWSWVSDRWNAITSAISGAVSTISGLVSSLASVFGRVKDAATDVYNWVADKFRAIGDAISNAVGAITGAIGRIVSAIKAPINAVVGAWNNLAFQFPTVTLPSVDIPFVGKIGGQTFGGWRFDFPNLPTLATGGMITGTGLVYAHAGEVIAPIEKVAGVGGPAVHIEHATFSTEVDVDLLMDRVAWALRTRTA